MLCAESDPHARLCGGITKLQAALQLAVASLVLYDKICPAVIFTYMAVYSI